MAKYSESERKVKPAAYRMLIRAEVIDNIYEQILHKMIVEKRFLDHNYTAMRMAEELNTNVRYISATVSLRFGMNYSQLISGYRLREALYMLRDRRNIKLTMTEVAQRCGFASRQTFYATFFKAYHKTPKEYQSEAMAKQAGRTPRKSKSK